MPGQERLLKRRTNKTRTIIAFATDFGNADGYVAAVKGVLITLTPESRVLDLAHDLPSGNITAARWCLLNCVNEYPKGTVFLVVVDPSVGTERPALAISYEDRYFIGPGNGIFDWVLGHGAQAVELDTSTIALRPLSCTFHGRDLFAPAAAMLANGFGLSDLGVPYSLEESKLGVPSPRQDAEGWLGEVLAVDRFGNVITNLASNPAEWELKMAVGNAIVEHAYAAYSEIPPGEAGMIIGSLGYWEAAMNGESLAAKCGAVVGDPVRLYWE